MSTVLQEFTYATAAHLRIDREAGVLRGVKLLGLTSANGRRYLESALREAAPLYEGAKVNVNHVSPDKGGPLAPRAYQDRLGVIRSVQFREGEGLFGDLHYNPKHALAEQLAWDAEHAPQNVGLSHSVLAHTASRTSANDAHVAETIVERIEKVQSVDLVADPATTRGLFECGMQNAECGMAPPHSDAPPEHSAFRTPNSAFAIRARRICELLTEHHLPLPGAADEHARCITSEAFLDSLWQAPDDEALEQSIKDRAALVEAAQMWCDAPRRTRHAERGGTLPTSRDQFAAAIEVPRVSPKEAARAFAESITAG